MKIEDMLEEFLSTKPDGYGKDVRIFFNYLIYKRLPIEKEIFQGVRTKNIIESINYYKENNNLESVSTAKRYTAAISEFFKYIIGKGYIENKEFYEELILPTIVEKSYLYKINQYISKDTDLRESGTFEILNRNDVEELIGNCDEVMNRRIKDITSKKKEYNKFIGALAIKLIAFTGVMYRVLRNLELTSDIEIYNKICINNFRITLPENLTIQLKKYLLIRKMILNTNKKESKYLFIKFTGEQLPVQTNISAFLATCTGRNDFNGLIKYAIRNMIMAGVNDSIIMKLTGASTELIQSSSYGEIKNWNRYLDSKIRNTDLFDFL